MNKLEIVKSIIQSGAITIRDVDAGEEPFIYSSGNRGPGYIMIKGLVGQPELCQFLISQLVEKLDQEIGTNIDFVNGNVTGGMIYGWEIMRQLSEIQQREIPFVYLRGSRKEGGHNELITGDLNNPLIKHGMRVLIVEELVNFAETTTNAVQVFREAGYKVNYTTCILSYDHDEANKKLQENNITLIPLITLPELLQIAKENSLIPAHLVDSYLDFLNNPLEWQLARNMLIPDNSAQDAIKKGYNMLKLNNNKAIELGAPESKIKTGVSYWKHHNLRNIFIALDSNNFPEVVKQCYYFSDYPSSLIGFKLNLDLFMNFKDGYPCNTGIRNIKSYNRPIFLDLKMWNGVRTMTNIINQCIELEIDIVNVYLHIGVKYLKELSKLTKGTKTKLFGVTVLTHYDDEYCQELYGKSMDDVIKMFSKWACEADLDGIILPPNKLHLVKDLPLLKLCPGIRPQWFHDKKINNQEQTETPGDAARNGADYLVIGSPIMTNADPKKALDMVLDEVV